MRIKLLSINQCQVLSDKFNFNSKFVQNIIKWRSPKLQSKCDVDPNALSLYLTKSFGNIRNNVDAIYEWDLVSSKKKKKLLPIISINMSTQKSLITSKYMHFKLLITHTSQRIPKKKKKMLKTFLNFSPIYKW